MPAPPYRPNHSRPSDNRNHHRSTRRSDIRQTHGWVVQQVWHDVTRLMTACMGDDGDRGRGHGGREASPKTTVGQMDDGHAQIQAVSRLVVAVAATAAATHQQSLTPNLPKGAHLGILGS